MTNKEQKKREMLNKNPRRWTVTEAYIGELRFYRVGKELYLNPNTNEPVYETRGYWGAREEAEKLAERLNKEEGFPDRDRCERDMYIDAETGEEIDRNELASDK